MGLMDRDYYRERKEEEGGTQEFLRKLRNNPFSLIALALIILFIISLIL